jgi:hypothetical protein
MVGTTGTWSTGVALRDQGSLRGFYPISNGRTAEEAIDKAIERYNRKHGVRPFGPPMECVNLPFRGWVS